MTIKELREKSTEELHVMLAERRNMLREVRFKVSQFQHKNYNELGGLKKDIARMMTVLRERSLIKEVV